MKTTNEITEEAFNWIKESEERLGQFASNELAWRDIVKRAIQIKEEEDMRYLEEILTNRNYSSACEACKSFRNLVKKELKEMNL